MRRPILIVLAVWAMVYLPALGSSELKGEEGRRILPAITMLQTGNASRGALDIFRSYIVPMIGSEPYLRKPPLVNWLVAGSFQLSGVRNEWTARLPSVFCVLLVALSFVTVASAALGRGALWAALAWLLNFGIMEKGRLIEIEALYVSLFGLAIICWLSAWEQRRSPWHLWLVTSVFLGLGLLAKGPVHLLFFYAIVFAVLRQTGELRALWQPAHFVGLMIMLGIFAAWAIPYLWMVPVEHAGSVWSRQFSGRVSGEDFKAASWIMNIPRAAAYFMPWLLFAPFVRFDKIPEARRRALAWALGWGTITPFVVVNLLPGALPRYAMPALAPGCWLVGMVMGNNALDWRLRLGRRRFPVSPVLGAWILRVLLVGAGIGFPLISATVQKDRHHLKQIAGKIDATIPPLEPLYAIDPDFQPFLFYVQSQVVCVSNVEDLPVNARFALVPAKIESALAENSRWSALHPMPVLRFTDYRKVTVSVVKLGERG